MVSVESKMFLDPCEFLQQIWSIDTQNTQIPPANLIHRLVKQLIWALDGLSASCHFQETGFGLFADDTLYSFRKQCVETVEWLRQKHQDQHQQECFHHKDTALGQTVMTSMCRDLNDAPNLSWMISMYCDCASKSCHRWRRLVDYLNRAVRQTLYFSMLSYGKNHHDQDLVSIVTEGINYWKEPKYFDELLPDILEFYSIEWTKLPRYIAQVCLPCLIEDYYPELFDDIDTNKISMAVLHKAIRLETYSASFDPKEGLMRIEDWAEEMIGIYSFP